jgi:hypothetical protein
MHEYDVTLKLLLRKSATVAMRELAGVSIENWLDIELPKVQNLRLDLLGETADNSLMHVELQSTNDPLMPLRMAEYCLGIYRLFRIFPRQLCLYVGQEPLRMEGELRGPDAWFHYTVADMRTIDGERLLNSPELSDNVIAILSRLRDHRDAVRRIFGKIARLGEAERETALGQLLILAGLRDLEEVVEQEASKMPIFIDITKNKVLGREYKRGLQEGELTLLRRLIEKRFGPLPTWAEERLAAKTTVELEELSLRVLDAQSVDDLLK